MSAGRLIRDSFMDIDERADRAQRDHDARATAATIGCPSRLPLRFFNKLPVTFLAAIDPLLELQFLAHEDVLSYLVEAYVSPPHDLASLEHLQHMIQTGESKQEGLGGIRVAALDATVPRTILSFSFAIERFCSYILTLSVFCVHVCVCMFMRV